MNKSNKHRSLKELTLMDRFLFAEAMENPENMKILLDIILEDDIELKQLPQPEREIRVDQIHKMARIDVWAEDIDSNVYDTEVQKHNTGNLPKRSRFYQSMLDRKSLKPGEENFNVLGKIFIIIIMPFDLFGKGLYKYTFCNTCKEVPGLELKDDAIRIFLNSRGKNDHEVSKKLVQLLHFMEYTNDSNNCKGFEDEQLQRLQQNVQEIQQNAEVGVKYMQLWEEIAYEKREARKEGLAEGRAEGRVEGKAEAIITLIAEIGVIPDSLKKKIFSETNLDVLTDWLKKAARATSVKEFEEMIMHV